AEVGYGIWAQDASGALRSILLTADQVDVDPGSGVQFRTVNSIDPANLGAVPTFNNLGQIVLNVGFTDGSYGLFVSNLVAVPEPAIGINAAICTTLLMGARARSRRR